MEILVSDKKVIAHGSFEDIKPTADSRFKSGEGFERYEKKGDNYYYKSVYWKSTYDEDGSMSSRSCHPHKLVEDEDLIKEFERAISNIPQ